jgi:hypothetical protein
MTQFKDESHKPLLARRHFLQRTGVGLGAIALGSLLNCESFADAETITSSCASLPHFASRAKHVIYLHMVGAPSHLDLLEHKPALTKFHGQPCPDNLLTKGQQFAFLRGHPKLMGSPFQFQKYGQSGLELSELLPHLSTVADELCLVKSLHTEEINHGPAQLFQMTGFGRLGRPSVGAWTVYGLGSENADLPAFVVMNTGPVAGAGSALWGPGFLPGKYQGVEFRSEGDPVLFLSDPRGIDRDDRRRIVDSINHLDRTRLADVGDPEIATRIEQYELAFRMQASVPDLMDISRESPEVHRLYGTTAGHGSFANNCLLARRLVERGVRFVQLFDSDWDHHGNLKTRLPAKCKNVDQAATALIIDLKRRGLLDQTLVIWGGEFGRTPLMQGNDGRDHHKDAYCMWMAGGGIKAGCTYGETDDIGFKVASDPVHVHDLHATILHLLGIDHLRLTYHHQGRDFRLTDVSGEVVRGILA